MIIKRLLKLIKQLSKLILLLLKNIKYLKFDRHDLTLPYTCLSLIKLIFITNRNIIVIVKKKIIRYTFFLSEY